MQRIQIGRGMAALLVVGYHANLYEPSAAGGFMLPGHSGVDFFFVLSGFLIAFIHARDIGHPERLPTYAVKRLRRIFPVYWVYTAGAILLHLALSALTGKSLIYWTTLHPATVAGSLALWPTDLAGGSWPILAVAWTLSYELLFYALFGMAILLGAAVSAAGLFGWVLLICLASAGVFGRPEPPFTTLTSSYNLEFVAGCAIGLYLTVRPRIRSSHSKITGIVGLALLGLAWFHAMAGYPVMPRLDALQFGIPYSLIIFSLASMDLSHPLNPAPGTATLSFFGDASFSIYLVHSLAMYIWAIVARDWSVQPDVIVAGAIAMGVGSGVIAYVLVERPLLTLLRGDTRKGLRARI